MYVQHNQLVERWKGVWLVQVKKQEVDAISGHVVIQPEKACGCAVVAC